MKKIGIVLMLAALIGCDNDEEKTVVAVNKNGGIETSMETVHLNDSMDIIRTHYFVHKEGNIVKSITHLDTIPGLGNTIEEDSLANSKFIKKDYEIFITIK
jgi:hypothetical protein